jgi:glycosyltransferase involved in cell wall biosynthesis
MDSDDLAKISKFAKQVEYLDANPQITFCGTWAELFGSMSYQVKPSERWDMLRVDFLFGCEFIHPSVMFRKQTVLDHGLFYDESLDATEDFELWSRWIETAPVANLPQILLRYRKHPGSATIRKSELGETVYREVIGRLLRRGGFIVTEEEIEVHFSAFTGKTLNRDKLQILRSTLSRLVYWNSQSGNYNHHYMVSVVRNKINDVTMSLLHFDTRKRALSPLKLIRYFATSQSVLARASRLIFHPIRRPIIRLIGNFIGEEGNSVTLPDKKESHLVDVKRIVYFIGEPEGESKRYRVENLVEVLRNAGRSVDVIFERDLASYRISPDLTTAVIFRASFSVQLQAFILRARKANVDVVFDVDDLVFEPESLEYIGAVRKLEESEKPWHLREINLIRRALLMCDAATASTEFLASRIRKLAVRSGVVRNSLNPIQVEFAGLVARTSADQDHVRVGFFSGSPTHQADFEELEDPLHDFLRANSNVVFVLVGYLELGPRWDVLADRTERHPFVPPLEMLELMASIDCLLVPLEAGNPFTNSKSEVKVFESALVGTPTICTAIDSYSRCIVSGRNGVLVRETSEWAEALKLILDSQLLKKMGEQARNDFVPYFSDIAAAKEALEFYSHVRSVRSIGIE